MPSVISKSKQLLVEGRDAQEFFAALLNHLALREIQVQNFGGVNQLRGFLKAFRSGPGFARVASLGIVRDAETDPVAAFQSVCSALRSASLPVPTQAMQPVGQNPRVNVLILPDATTPGMLETICLRTVAHDPVIECVTRYFQCVEQQTGRRPGNIDKARVQAFLASRHRPGLLLGQAAHAGYWDLSSPALEHVRQFVQQL